METKPTLAVRMGTAGTHFAATFALDSGAGEGSWSGSPVDGWVPGRRTIRRQLTWDSIAPQLLTKLCEISDAMWERGSEERRCDQFPQATVHFDATNDAGETVSWTYHVEGGLPGGLNPVYDAVAVLVRDAVHAQRSMEAQRQPLLPSATNDSELGPVHRLTEPWLAATREVAKRHGFDTEGWERATDGSHIVMIGSDVVLKFFVPFWERTIDYEEAAMDLVDRELPVATPRVLARGEFEGWEYLGFTRVQGVALRNVELPPEDALRVASSLGESLRALHDIKVPADSPLRSVVPKWRAFLSEQRKRRAELERARGTSEEWTARVVDYLRPWRYRKRPTSTLLHADLTLDHILVERVDDRWELAGLVDLGDAKVGDAAYEFAALFAFWTGRRPELRAAMLDGYGVETEAFLDRIFESLLLHEFGRLALLDLDGVADIEGIRDRYVATV